MLNKKDKREPTSVIKNKNRATQLKDWQLCWLQHRRWPMLRALLKQQTFIHIFLYICTYIYVRVAAETPAHFFAHPVKTGVNGMLRATSAAKLVHPSCQAR